MADKASDDGKTIRRLTSRRINMDQPVNQTVTLPSAEKPAEPPKRQGQASGKKGSATAGENS